MQTHTCACTHTTDREVTQEGLGQQPEVHLANRLHSALVAFGEGGALVRLLLLVLLHLRPQAFPSVITLPPLPTTEPLVGPGGGGGGGVCGH